jgi:hypothetical protein
MATRSADEKVTSRSMPAGSAHMAEIPVPDPLPMMGTPRITFARNCANISLRVFVTASPLILKSSFEIVCCVDARHDVLRTMTVEICVRNDAPLDH